ncbi:MAG: Wzz/FepE/Etk N-terminal domain-containing protein [Candidatus Ratteibacteria bacterium]|jgi:uncharacterized protein involved in exopolysaccharide biosynthesis
MDEQEISLLDYWRVLWKNRLLIIVLFFVVSAGALIYSLRLPKLYKATTSILSPADSSKGAGLSSLLGALGSQGPIGLTITAQPSSSEVFVAILKSRSAADKVIDRFNLQEIYGTKTKESARGTLAGNTEIKISKEKMINVSVLDKDPNRAAEIANYYVETLDELNQTLSITTAGEKKRFLEKRLEETKEDLKKAEERLKNYQVNHKILAASETDQSAKTAGELQGNLLAARVELEAKKRYATSQNPEVINLQNQVTEMERAITSLPPLETELARLIRDLKIQNTVYSLLVSQYEQTKIEEARDTPTVQVLDQAAVPEKKFKPNIRQNVALSGIIALFLGIFISFLKENASKTKE